MTVRNHAAESLLRARPRRLGSALTTADRGAVGAHRNELRALIVHYVNLSPAEWDHLSARSLEVVRPVVHQVPAALEQVGARIGCLDLVAHL